MNLLGNAHSKTYISAEYFETYYNGVGFQASS